MAFMGLLFFSFALYGLYCAFSKVNERLKHRGKGDRRVS